MKALKIISIIALGMIILGWVGVSFYIAREKKPEFIQGQIEAPSYTVSSKVAGRIEEIFVKKGDIVKKGDLIYNVYSPELEAKIFQAKAGYEGAKSLSKETSGSVRIETLNSAKETYLAAKALADLASKTYTRINNLYSSGVVSLQRKDEAEANYKSAKSNENTAYQQYQLALNGANKEMKNATKQKELAALGTLDEVQSYAKDAQAFSPIDGEVSNILLHKSELSPSGFPVVLITDVNNMYARFHITENKLKDYKINNEFEAFIPALGENIRFKVRYISLMGDFATWKDSKESYDMKSYEVEADVVSSVKNLRIGMSVLIKK